MNIEKISEYCLSKPNTFESFPFDDDVLVFNVTLRNGKHKMFALTSFSRPNYLLLKCDPDRALDLRDQYDDIEPGFHMNKRHWNGLFIDRSLSPKLIKELIDHSFELVVKK